jgi:hypothetical protein
MRDLCVFTQDLQENADLDCGLAATASNQMLVKIVVWLQQLQSKWWYRYNPNSGIDYHLPTTSLIRMLSHS